MWPWGAARRRRTVRVRLGAEGDAMGRATAELDRATRPRGPRTRPRRTWVRRTVAALSVLAVAGLGIVGAAIGTLATSPDRVDGVFDDLASRPDERAPRALDVLLVSTDLVTVVHVDGDRRRVSVLWLPPDTPPTVAAVESVTGVRIDHYAALDWSVLAELEPTAGPFWPPFEHSDDPIELARHQRDYLQMVIGGNVHQEMAKNPVMLYGFLRTMGTHLTIDREWGTADLARLAVSLHAIRSWDVQYLSAPSGGAAAAWFWDAVARDDTDGLAALAAVAAAGQ